MNLNSYVTLMIIPDGAEARRGVRMRQWHYRAILGGLALFILGIVLFFIFYGKIMTKAVLADKFQEENERLLKYQYKVQLLEQNLNQTREIVSRLTSLAGVDIKFPEMPDDSTLFASLDEAAVAAVQRAAGPDLSVPSGLPVKGFITQDFILEDSTHYHPGIDIACAEGTPVLATATGEVVMSGFDAIYGNIVVIKHNDSTTTLYGHNKEILVEKGEKVLPGSRLALSGNTGKSTAPHVHYEIRVNDEPINPMEMQ